jgi:muramoyltetrapeptide carboxypeptidase
MSLRQRPTILPDLPKPGDTIGVVAPASNIIVEALERGCDYLRRLGFKVFFHDSIRERQTYFAGSHERRVWELHQMFEKRFVKAIICARGGYGSNYLLPLLNLDLIRANPKMLMGYSDNTSILTYIHDQTGLVTYHGPMVTKDFADAETAIDFTSPLDARVEGQQIKAGQAKGKLYGGCLSMLAASLGTPYEITTRDTVLFVEDIATKPFQIDRMLMQLKFAGKLEHVRGIIFGEMADCVQPGGQDYTLQQVVSEVLKDFKGPIGFGLRSGHLSDYSKPGVTLALGSEVELNVQDHSMTIRAAAAATPTSAF